MTRQPTPPRPVTSLDRLLARLADDLQQVPIDPDLGRRVEALIRTGPSMPRPERQRSVPGWAAIAAGVLLTLGAGLSTRSAPPPLDRGTQLPFAPPSLPEEDLDPPPIDPLDLSREAER